MSLSARYRTYTRTHRPTQTYYVNGRVFDPFAAPTRPQERDADFIAGMLETLRAMAAQLTQTENT